MPTISLCMIVKNEENVLARCLDSINDLVDEIVIVDTGSTDKTKEIAARYTNKIYDFEWIKDFSAARNFADSKATCDYIYTADADEVLDEDNRKRFRDLKTCLLPEIEIVQMKYVTKCHDTVLNSKKELRPKLYKRLRTFTWIDPVHETLRIDPVVFDSDIEITHLPENMHHKRDFSVFENALKRGSISTRIGLMYAKELYKNGELEDYKNAYDYLYGNWYNDPACDLGRASLAALTRYAILSNDTTLLLKLSLSAMNTSTCSEVCFELGEYFSSINDTAEAHMWYYNAYYETESILDVHAGGDLALKKLIATGKELGTPIDKYDQELKSWSIPEEL